MRKLRNPSFRSSLFQKAGRNGRGSAPSSPSAEGETTLMIPKDQEGRSNSPVGCRTVGNPIKGFPAGRSPAKNAQTITAPARETTNVSTRWRGFSLWINSDCVMPQFLRNCGCRFLRAACGPPFPIFGLRPRRNGVKVSHSAEREEGSALHLPAF